MIKALTTIEFCEKSMKNTGFDSSAYNRGFCGNVRAVLGDNPLFWLLPVSPPSGNGLSFSNVNEETPMMEAGRGIRQRSSGKLKKSRSKRRTGGTGETAGTG